MEAARQISEQDREFFQQAMLPGANGNKQIYTMMR